MPTKVNALIDYLAALYGQDGHWERGLDQATLTTLDSTSGKNLAKARPAVRDIRLPVATASAR